MTEQETLDGIRKALQGIEYNLNSMKRLVEKDDFMDFFKDIKKESK